MRASAIARKPARKRSSLNLKRSGSASTVRPLRDVPRQCCSSYLYLLFRYPCGFLSTVCSSRFHSGRAPKASSGKVHEAMFSASSEGRSIRHRSMCCKKLFQTGFPSGCALKPACFAMPSRRVVPRSTRCCMEAEVPSHKGFWKSLLTFWARLQDRPLHRRKTGQGLCFRSASFPKWPKSDRQYEFVRWSCMVFVPQR